MRLLSSPAWLRPFESIWSLLYKLAVANATTVQEVFRIFVQRGVLRGPDLWTWGAGHALQACESMLGSALSSPHTTTLASVLQTPNDRARIRRALRYCPECLETAFHSVLFQVQDFERCPLHRCELISRCAVCAAPLPYFRGEPGRCAHCVASFATPPTDWPKTFKAELPQQPFRALAHTLAEQGGRNDLTSPVISRTVSRPAVVGPIDFWDRHPHNARLTEMYFEHLSAISIAYFAEHLPAAAAVPGIALHSEGASASASCCDGRCAAGIALRQALSVVGLNPESVGGWPTGSRLERRSASVLVPYLYEERSGGVLTGEPAELVIRALALQNLFDAFSVSLRDAHAASRPWELPTRDRRIRWHLAEESFTLEQVTPALNPESVADAAQRSCLR